MTSHPTELPTAAFNLTSPASSSGGNGSTNFTLSRDEDLARIEIAVQSLVFFLAVFGNGIVLIVLLAWRRKKLSRMNMMIVHLSCADLFVAFFNVLPQLIWDVTVMFYGNDFLCRMVKYFQVVAMYASSYVLVSTAIDRYLAICHPLTSHTWTLRKAHLLVAAAWACSLVFAIPQLVIFSYEWVPVYGAYQCWGSFKPAWTLELYVTWFTVAIYIVPFLVLTVAYGRICFVVWASMKSKETGPVKDKSTRHSNLDRISKHGTVDSRAVENGSLLNNPETVRHHGKIAHATPRAHVRGGMSRAKVKTVKLTLTVIVCYLICWGPFFISQMWSAWDHNAPFEGNSAMAVILLLASLNSCTNPWIYLFFIDNFCAKSRRIFRSGTASRTKFSVFNFGSTMVVFLLLASLNSCTNPWIYLAFSDSLQRSLRRCFSSEDKRGGSRFGDTDTRFRSTIVTSTDMTRLESVSNGRSSTYQMKERQACA